MLPSNKKRNELAKHAKIWMILKFTLIIKEATFSVITFISAGNIQDKPRAFYSALRKNVVSHTHIHIHSR